MICFGSQPLEEAQEDRKVRLWYVLHVKPRTEKKVFEYLRRIRVFRYLPLFKKVSKIQRRRVVTYLPMFPGYVFARLNADERLVMLQTQLLVRTILVPNPRLMIHQLRQIAHAGRLSQDMKVVVHFDVGEHVRMKSGPFMGIDGYVQRRGAAASLVLKLEILGQAVEVSVNPLDVEKL